eukprot:c4514_g1_i2.p1 GENE.c4514_g1_i2~~c4514_g1_i2.p1  ORF type:complete len:120 (-),score=47.36 c4514_g1_i2:80-400(-)
MATGFKITNIPSQRGIEDFEKENAQAEGGKIMITFTGLPEEFKREFVVSNTVQDLKAIIEAEKMIPYDTITLIDANDKVMADPMSLSDIGISGTEATIKVQLAASA